MDLNQIKNRFEIIGRNPALDRAIDVATKVAKADVPVLVTGESGVGKEVIPKIIHEFSPRKHQKYMAINCGAIPEGTINSELFGHEKGAFTGAVDTRKGYFEEADGGTLFLDEVAELPLSTQVQLLRVLQSGEFLKVGSSKVQKTNVRVIAATNVNLQNAIATGKFREDLYFRLCTVEIKIPALRERRDDIHLLFRKFAGDFAERNIVPTVRLTEDAVAELEAYPWPGNIRQLKNVAEQVSIMEDGREVNAEALRKYLVKVPSHLPVVLSDSFPSADYSADKDIIFRALFNLRDDINKILARMDEGSSTAVPASAAQQPIIINAEDVKSLVRQEEEVLREEEASASRSIQEAELDLIRKALERNHNNRKAAARELGISERTLYRKIKEMGI